MKFLYMVDEIILDYFERFCHSVQGAIGVTNFDIARYSALLGIICDIVYYLFIRAVKSPFSVFMALCFFVFLLVIVSYVERQTEINVGNGYVNSYRLSGQNTRIVYALFVLFHCVVDIVEFLSLGRTNGLLMTLSALATTLVFYLLSCTPLPPGSSKLKEFFSKFKLTPLSEVQPNES